MGSRRANASRILEEWALELLPRSSRSGLVPDAVRGSAARRARVGGAPSPLGYTHLSNALGYRVLRIAAQLVMQDLLAAGRVNSAYVLDTNIVARLAHRRRS